MGENPQGLGPHCGASENSLPPGTAVAAYTIRQLLSQNGEGFVYLGSSSQEEAVWIKEFFPNGLCRRDPASQSLSICPGCEAKVKYFRAAFADTNQTLGKLTGVDSLPTLLELIEEHNTVYAVFRYIPGQTLAQWLEDHPGGELLPNFVGRSPETVMRDANYYDRYFFTVEEQYHEEIGKGYVCGQKPEAGTAVPRGSTITLYVSLGSEKLTMPDLYGAQQADAIARMNSLGMDYRIYQLENSEVEPGQVFRTDPPAGTVLKKTALPRVVLYVAKESTQQKQETTKPQVIRPRTQSQTAEEGDDEPAAE